MKQFLLAIAFGWVSVAVAPAQIWAPANGCASGQCPSAGVPFTPPAPSMVQPPAAPPGAGAIVRVVNALGTSRSLGTGTLVDADKGRGLVITCAHLFHDGAGRTSVTFPSGRGFDARLIKIDAAADLAALAIGAPEVAPVEIAQRFPERGDPLMSCGYGSDGHLWCNRGQALGYVSTAGAAGTETLEMSGMARFGDSGGPVFDRDHRMVAVLFGTNGRVVDGTFCGRIRQFLRGLSPRFGSRQPTAPSVPSRPDAPLVDVPPAPPAEPAPPAVPLTPEMQPPAEAPRDASAERLSKLEELVSRIHSGWQAVSDKIDALAAAAKSARQAAPEADGAALGPPNIELPPGLAPLDPIEETARPWLSAELTALLVSLGVPGGIAGVAAGAVVYVVMRRAKQRLQTELDRLKGRGAGAATAAPTVAADAAAASDPAIVERHHNQYVAYQTTATDKAWAAAHAHVGEKYPGAVPYLKIAEGVKDQLLSGNNDPLTSQGRLP